MNLESLKDKAEITCLVCIFAVSLLALTPSI